MKASMFAAMGYSKRHTFPSTWPVAPVHADPQTSVESYREGMEECELAEEMGFDWLSFSERTGIEEQITEPLQRVLRSLNGYRWC